jgi:HK97 family phage prohead protease
MASTSRRIIQVAGVDELTRSVPILASTANPVEVDYVDKDGNCVRILEAIESWELERFLSNPALLWSHKSDEMPVGNGEDVEAGDFGLKMRAVIGSKEANPFAEQLYHALKEKLVRAVSVGFDVVEERWEEWQGKPLRVVKANLHEVSFCSVPKDQRAGAPAIGSITPEGETDPVPPPPPAPFATESDEDKQRREVSEAASRLSKSRRKPDPGATAKMDMREGSLRRALQRGTAKVTQVGGVRIRARLARIGVLRYRNPNGSERFEFRPPEEVADPASLESLNGAPVIDFLDHTEFVTLDDIRSKQIGHVENARMDGEYVVGDLVINDANAIDAIDRGERLDTSAGYGSRDDETPGSFRGEHYDLIQRGIRYNHVALCPPNRGRSGPAVGLRLDASDTDGAWCATETDMTTEAAKTRIRLDTKDGQREFDYGSKEHLDAVEGIRMAEITGLKSTIETLQGKFDAQEDTIRKLREEKETDRARAEDERKRAEEEGEKRAFGRAKRLLRAADFLEEKAEDEDEKRKRARAEEEEEAAAKSGSEKEEVRKRRRKRAEEAGADKDGAEKKMDACTERELMVRVIRRVSPDFTAEGRSDDYLSARFDGILEDHEASRRVDGVVAAAAEGRTRLDAKDADDDVVEQARKANQERERNAHRVALGGAK